MRKMGLDFGSKTVGVAISDPFLSRLRELRLYAGSLRISFARHWRELRN